MFEKTIAKLKRWFPAEPPLTELQLKSITFDPTNVSWYAQNGYRELYTLLGGGTASWSGETVSRASALSHSAVFACNRIISESIGSLPAVLMLHKGNQKTPATDHPMYGAMKNAPSDEITAQVFRELFISHTLLQGNAYARISRRTGTGTALELYPLDPDSVLPDREKTGAKRLVYVVKEQNQPDKTYTVNSGKPHDIFHLRGLGWDGIRGYSVIQMGCQSIGSALAAERNTAAFWANGGRIPYLLEMAGRFKNQEDFDKFRANWEKVYSVPNRAPILENDIKYKQIGLSMEDAQALETRQWTVSEICRWFNVSPHLAQDHSRSTFSNIEQLALDFVKFTLTPHMVRMEQDFWRCVLTPEEKEAGYYLKLNANAFLRGDFKTRMDGFASALQNGHLNIDEVRELEDRNPLPEGNGEEYHIQLNMQTLGEPVQPTVVSPRTKPQGGNEDE
jgi:HK97 family phage portal protein